jgi:hypothetical protein
MEPRTLARLIVSAISRTRDPLDGIVELDVRAKLRGEPPGTFKIMQVEVMLPQIHRRIKELRLGVSATRGHLKFPGLQICIRTLRGINTDRIGGPDPNTAFTAFGRC